MSEPLRARTKTLVALGALAAVGLIVASVLVVLERRHLWKTQRVLDDLIAHPERLLKATGGVGGRGPGTVVILFEGDSNELHLYSPDNFNEGPYTWGHNWLRDGWGRALRFRRPGLVHPRGWDLWSVGANGIDEQGGGDDILVGAEVAPPTSAD